MTAPTKNVVDLPVLGGVVTGDKLIVVDVSDTTEGPLGTTKVATLETIESIFDDSLAEAAASAATATTKAADASASAALAEAIALGVASGRPSVRPTLMLDFVNSDVVDPRITFTRASAGAYYDGKTYAKAEENLALYSQEFENAYWGKINSSISANATTSPDGTLTGDKFIGNTTAGEHNINRAGLTPVGTVATNSIYVKAGEITWILVHDVVANGCYFNIGTPAVGSAIGNATGGTITDVGGGWYRCSYTYTSTSASCGIGANLTTGDGVPSYTGANNTDGLYVWGAQCEQRSALTAYTPTTTAPITRYQMQLLSAGTDVWRPDYDPVTGVCNGRLVEPAATNLLQYSEDFSNAAWVKYESSVISNDAVAPDGTITADTIKENTSTEVHGIYQIVAIAAGTWTFSVHVSKSFVGIRNFHVTPFGTGGGGAGTEARGVIFNQLGQQVGYTGSSGTLPAYKVEDKGRYFRISITGTTSNAATVYPGVGLIDGTTQSYTGNGSSSMTVWGAQLEAGPLTSYIKTTGATATRAADLPAMTGANFSSWYNQSEGTFLIEYVPYKSSVSNYLIAVNNSTVTDYIELNTKTNLNTVALYIVRSTTLETAIVSSGTVNLGEKNTVAFSYAQNYAELCLNGVSQGIDTATILPILSQFALGHYDEGSTGGHGTGPIPKVMYWPKKLTSAEIQILSGSGA